MSDTLTYEQELDLRLSRIANFARDNKLSPDAVFVYFQIGQLAAAQYRQLKDTEHGDNMLVTESGEPITTC